MDAWDKALSWIKEDDTAYVITGDIPLMWLRDSVAQVTPYLSIANDPSIQRLMEGLLRRIMVWIDMDPYGSSFRMELDFDHAGKKRLTDWDFKCGRTSCSLCSSARNLVGTSTTTTQTHRHSSCCNARLRDRLVSILRASVLSILETHETNVLDDK